MLDLQDGWLVFESGREKRRLEAPYPSAWQALPLDHLETLCARASLVIRRKRASSEPRALQAAEIEQGVIANTGSRRTFTSPGGRQWTARIHECFDREGGQQKVLRFTADDIVVELSSWPDDWATATVQDYALMLLDASPPRRLAKGKGPQRRHEDRAE